MAQIINLTPHKLTFVNGEGEVVTEVEPSGTVARLSTTTVTTGEVAGIPVTETRFGEIEGLPEPREDAVFVVSSLVAGRVPNRKDVFIPNESVRDSQGRIVGCKSLGRI